MSTKQCRSFDHEVVPLILSCLGTYGCVLQHHWNTGNHRVFTSMIVNPKGFTDWREFFVAYQASVILKKFPALNTGINTSAVALSKFLESEENCRSVNAKLTRSDLSLSFRDRSIFERARSEIKRILGKFSWDAALPYLSHGPGACVGLRREFGHPWYKYGKQKPSVTGECLALVRCLATYSNLWKQRFDEHSDFDLVRASKVAIVPKDARGGRTIAIEPLWNMFFQKGIGGLMRSRLRRSGCNLNDQTINQQRAQDGSLTGRLCTIDLSSASDSISRVLVERLLPDDWVDAMKSVRTSRATLPSGDETYLQKFSSMGNGFTFELESLIFLALGRACSNYLGESGHDVSVYGDDIVAPYDTTQLLIDVLSTLGFRTNVEKSFVDGPFRESCGKHYFRGHDVTPFFLKRKITGVDEIFHVLNSIRRLAFRSLGIGYGLDGRWKQCYEAIYRLVPPRFRGLSIPDGYGDTGIVRDFDEVCPRPKPAKAWIEGYTTPHLVKNFEKIESGDFAGLMYRLTPREPCGDVIRPEQFYDIALKRFTLKVGRLLVPRWPALGPWVESF
jgi:hypothetical protein